MHAETSHKSRDSGGAIATSHHLATEAGAEVLRRGGNAIDAAIAAAAVLCVVYPHNVALGGDLVALVRSPDGRVRFVNATGRAASGESLEALRGRHGLHLPQRGIDTVTIPGGVRGWEALDDLGGRLSWADRLGAARMHAADGVAVASSLARAIRATSGPLSQDAGAAALFLPDAVPLQEGDLLCQPRLAATIDAIIEGGPGAFYVGRLAERWVAGLARLGSRITAEDAGAYSPELTDPIRLRTRDVEVLTSPPNTQGFSLLRSLHEIDRRGLQDPLGEDAARLAALFAEGNRIRAARLADPGVGSDSAADLIAATPPADEPTARGIATGDTVGLSVVSDDGWAVSLVQSVYMAFGAAVLEPDTGVLFQNRGTAFALDPAHPAAFQPGTRPPHTLMPVMVLRDGELAHVQSTMGGQAQPQIHLHLLLRLLDGASAVEATSAPRWSVGPQVIGDAPALITIEADVRTDVAQMLEQAAEASRRVPPRDEDLGHSNVVVVTQAGYDAASDPRSDGSAIIVRGWDAR